MANTMESLRAENPFGQAQPGALAAAEQTKALSELQTALIMARRFPRDPIVAMDRILQACSRPTLAERGLYSYARGGTDITGPSIYLAKAMAQHWGNLTFGIREIENRNGSSLVESFCYDLETNTKESREFQVAHGRYTRSGGMKKVDDPRDVYEIVANMGSRRLRACILGIIPDDVTDAAVRQVEITLKTRVEITPEKIKSLIDKFSELKITSEQLETRIQRRLDAITPAGMIQLGKIYNSIKDGISKPDDWFASQKKEEGPMDKLRGDSAT